MSNLPTIAVLRYELELLFDALGLSDKILDGRIASQFIPGARRPSRPPKYPGGTRDIVRHFNALGYQVATSHRITMPDGTIPHSHPKDLHIGEIVIYAE
jgi:hypothetical protein